MTADPLSQDIARRRKDVRGSTSQGALSLRLAMLWIYELIERSRKSEKKKKLSSCANRSLSKI